MSDELEIELDIVGASEADEEGWIGVDLDCTLAKHTKKEAETNEIGDPILPMVKRVKRWLANGKDVRIFTARLAVGDKKEITRQIQDWCEEHIGVRLPVTNEKDPNLIELWDDRAVQVMPNTGETLQDKLKKKSGKALTAAEQAEILENMQKKLDRTITSLEARMNSPRVRRIVRDKNQLIEQIIDE